jgi:hypothetical protein
VSESLLAAEMPTEENSQPTKEQSREWAHRQQLQQEQRKRSSSSSTMQRREPIERNPLYFAALVKYRAQVH